MLNQLTRLLIMRRIRSLLLLLAFFGSAASGASAPLEVRTALTDSLQITCKQPQPARVSCDYRLIHPAVGEQVAVAVDGTPVHGVAVAPYPYDHAASIIMILVDTSDPAREPVIQRNIQDIDAMLEAARPHQRFALATFDSNLRMLAPLGSPVSEVLEAAKRIKATGKTTELYRNALQAVRYLGSQPADRRALFLMSDGLAEDQAYFHQDVIRAAREGGVVIYGLGYPRSPSLSVALQTLRRLSEETGGLFVAAEEGGNLPREFTADPFAAMDSGGRLDVDLKSLADGGMRGSHTMSITVNTAQGALLASLPVDLPQPTPPREEMPVQAPLVPAPALAAQPAPVRKRPPRLSAPAPSALDYTLVIGGVLLLVLLATLLWPTKHRRRTTPGRENKEAPHAYLEFPARPGAQAFGVTTTALRIGRHRDNDLALDDPSVSRHHAEIHRKRDGSFTITDLDSLNGVFVNDRQVKSASLAEGDLVEVGDVQLRFTLSPGDGSNEEDRTVMGLDRTVMSSTKAPIAGRSAG